MFSLLLKQRTTALLNLSRQWILFYGVCPCFYRSIQWTKPTPTRSVLQYLCNFPFFSINLRGGCTHWTFKRSDYIISYIQQLLVIHIFTSRFISCSPDISGSNIMSNMTSKRVPSPTLCLRLKPALMLPSGCLADPPPISFTVNVFNKLVLSTGYLDTTTSLLALRLIKYGSLLRGLKLWTMTLYLPLVFLRLALICNVWLDFQNKDCWQTFNIFWHITTLACDVKWSWFACFG